MNRIRAFAGIATASVDVGASYGIYQEYGTYKMATHPFMTPAAEAVRPSFMAAMRQLV